MLADLDETLRKILIDRIPIRNGEIDIKFDQPKREWSARLSKPTVNMFLYDMRENAQLRRQQFERTRHNGRVVAEQRTAYRMDCFYMITTWAAEAEDEHRLMWRTVHALFQYPSLAKESLTGKLKGHKYDIPIQLARHDRLTNPAEVWSALDNELRPTIGYIVTLEMNPWEEVSGPAVRYLSMQTKRGTDRSKNTVVSEMVRIGGTIKRDDEAVAGVQVQVKGTGYAAITDENGRFRLGSILPGEYTLIAWPSDGDPQETAVSITTSNDNYDIILK